MALLHLYIVEMCGGVYFTIVRVRSSEEALDLGLSGEAQVLISNEYIQLGHAIRSNLYCDDWILVCPMFREKQSIKHIGPC